MSVFHVPTSSFISLHQSEGVFDLDIHSVCWQIQNNLFLLVSLVTVFERWLLYVLMLKFHRFAAQFLNDI